eukprot:CAMPEP_0197696872 /NCGR_PEP_ID=MMETSP1338-20131121/117214_1 /TAXON_ID=43686 ORGANISM="Pelagodinium beii, Strain RCC1491" /NCGR_SAMPLE_ID=MMETSP1338 /ASSEMBLY_ACC=CAM_ASM_000754 /LENGTH=86 /DNA_ID=CAMNT_0043280055 /DNA_START=191 /DNA_END=451 /DNA_ORIENTATION=-
MSKTSPAMRLASTKATNSGKCTGRFSGPAIAASSSRSSVMTDGGSLKQRSFSSDSKASTSTPDSPMFAEVLSDERRGRRCSEEKAV